MTVPRWYGLAGTILAVGMSITFLVAAYAWLGGSLWRFLDHLFSVFLILMILWLLALPFFPTLTWKHRFLSMGIFTASVLLPALIFQNGFYRLFIPSALLLRSFSSDPTLLVLESAILLLLLTYVVRVSRDGIGTTWRGRKIRFFFCLFLSLFCVPILAGTNVTDAVQRIGYGLLLFLRGEHKATNPAAVVLRIKNEQMSRDHFVRLMNMLEEEEPTVIGVISTSGRPIWGIDSPGISRTIPRVFEHGSNPLNLEAEAGIVSADRQAGLYGPPLGMPMYFEPFGKRGIDFSVKLAHRHLTSREMENRFQISSRSVVLGGSAIPLIGGRRAFINHYWTYREEQIGKYGVPGFRTLSYDEFEEDGIRQNYIWDSERYQTYFKVNYMKERFEAPIGKEIVLSEGSVTWKARELEPAPLGLRGKILVVEITGLQTTPLPLPGIQSDAHVIASIAQSILDDDFIRGTQPDTNVIFIVLLVFLVWLTYQWLGAFQAFGLTFLGGALIATGAFVAFVQAEYLLNSNMFILPLAASLLVFFPVGVVSERQAMARERTRLQIELRAARDMQMGLMPKEDPVIPGFDIAGSCIPANEVGGDFFDYVWLDEKKTRLGIAVADVSGKAMKAAITAVMTSGMMYQEVGNGQSPKKILRKINKPLFMKIDERMFTALSFAVLDSRTKELVFSNAGQMYPALNRNGSVILLEVKGARLPLGVKEDVKYDEMAVKLKKGDVVIFYTDGIPEAKNEKDEFYGFDRFKALTGGIRGASAKEIRDRILEDVRSFTGRSPQYDDMTVVVLKVGDRS